jgi:hypothetical protein
MTVNRDDLINLSIVVASIGAGMSLGALMVLFWIFIG